MREIEVKNITLMEKVETKEAEEIYNNHKWRYCLLKFIPIFCFFTFLILTIIQANKETMKGYQLVNEDPELFIFYQIMLVVSIFAIFLCLHIYRKKMKPFRELLDVAKLNDKIRHEEKIRERERKRLKTENKTKYTTKEIKETISETKKQGQ